MPFYLRPQLHYRAFAELLFYLLFKLLEDSIEGKSQIE
jgi:hypothetical protein